jgi:iron(III) transport system ATP-binding protein
MHDQESSAYLAVRDVTKTFGRSAALAGISFEARRGEFVCLLGPSGCGKTTALRVVAGLERQEAGQVLLESRDVSAWPVARRNVGIVFQSYALFPNLTAAQNVGYGLMSRRLERYTAGHRVAELLALVGLQGSGDKYPAQLSGGQQQRVALARAMALRPGLLLLDEPLSALDAQVRLHLRSEVRQLQRRLGVTTLMVTHDQEEALTMADRILVMDRGRVVQDGTPLEIYNRPSSPFVASFIGSMNFLPDAAKEASGLYRVNGFRLAVDADADSLPVGARATMAIRPEEVVVRPASEAVAGSLIARVASLEFRGPHYRLTLHLPTASGGLHMLQADVPTERMRRLALREGMDLAVELPSGRLRVYGNETLSSGGTTGGRRRP